MKEYLNSNFFVHGVSLIILLRSRIMVYSDNKIGVSRNIKKLFKSRTKFKFKSCTQ